MREGGRGGGGRSGERLSFCSFFLAVVVVVLQKKKLSSSLTLPKGPESTSSTDWKSDLPEWRISLTSIDHFRSSWSSSSS